MEDGIRNPEKIRETVTSTLEVMKNVTSSTSEISPGDLSSSIDILEKIVNVTNSSGSTIEGEVEFLIKFINLKIIVKRNCLILWFFPLYIANVH